MVPLVKTLEKLTPTLWTISNNRTIQTQRISNVPHIMESLLWHTGFVFSPTPLAQCFENIQGVPKKTEFQKFSLRHVSFRTSFLPRKSKKPTNPRIWRLSDYPIIRFKNIENYYRPKCNCVFDIVFVFVFDFVFVSFCICLLLFIHQRALSGWLSTILIRID